MRWPRLIGGGLAGITLAIVAVTTALLATQDLGVRPTVILGTLAVAGSLTTFLGLVISRRAGAGRVGLLLAAIGFGVVFLCARDVYYRSWLADPTVVP
jgi:hypothetical protein